MKRSLPHRNTLNRETQENTGKAEVAAMHGLSRHFNIILKMQKNLPLI